VLVADGNAASRDAIERTLRSAGCEVRCAASASEVEALLAGTPSFDAVLLDPSLAGAGFRAVSIPIVGLGSIRAEGALPELAASLRKPIKEQELLDAIASATLAAPAAPSTAA
jgi:FixJ family two-component response regulator